MATTLRGIEDYKTGDGAKRYRVRWEETGKRKSKSFTRLGDARAFHSQLRVSKETGKSPAAVANGSGGISLAEFVKETWSERAQQRLAPKTYEVHKAIYNKHILHQLGAQAIGSIDTEDLAIWQDSLQAAGVGESAIYRALCVLSSIFKEAARRSRSTGVGANPVRNLDWPRAKRAKQPKVFPPAVIEEVRAELLLPRAKGKGSTRSEKLRVRNAAMVSLLAYTGIRPGEMLALQRDQIGKKDIHITHAVSMGVRRDTVKSGQNRLVPIRPAVRADLEALVASWDIGPSDLLFPSKSGEVWGETQWKNWRRKTYNRAVSAVAEREGLPELEGTRPYDLGRHSHSALMLASGISLPRLAELQGHSVAVLSSNYTQVLREYEDSPAIDPDKEIKKARSKAFASKDPSTGL